MDRSEVEKISKALADETRLRIFEVISATNHMNCGEIVSMRGGLVARWKTQGLLRFELPTSGLRDKNAANRPCDADGQS